jgi:saccharopine dehydrogenase (NAD+, L-lysine forming)
VLAYTTEQPLRIGVLREGKNPPDQRVPLTPDQCVELQARFPQVDLVVQPSPVRRIRDVEYSAAGVRMQEDLSDRDILLGVKEVNAEDLLEDKTYLFFSHTYKLQPYNAPLLAAILAKRVRLVDYEMLKRPSGKRIVGFGRWAGLVGCYNGLRAYGLRSGRYSLPRAIDCANLADMLGEAKAASFPDDFKIVLTGYGRVGLGAKEVLDHLNIRNVHKDDFLTQDFPEPVFCHLNTDDYNAHKTTGRYDRNEFRNDPTRYKSTFLPFGEGADLFIAGHFWSEGSPFLFTREDMQRENWRMQVVADVSCDTDGPVACTLRPSTIADPVYGYDPASESECIFDKKGCITVMAVDNLPCELPRDASDGFGWELMDYVLPLLIEGDRDAILYNATETTLEGELNTPFAYLSAYADTHN